MKIKLIIPLILISLGISSIYAYETEWQDKKLGTTQFKTYGYMWIAYEKMDSQKGIHDTGNRQGFNINRAYVRFAGKVKDGDFKNWKYHVTIDGTPGGSEFLKYAYIGIPIPGDILLIAGLQNTPTVNAGKYHLEKLWGHRYLDTDGKAMWDQLSVTSSSDLGIGLEQTKNFYNFNLLIANGEGYKKSANGLSIQNTTLSDLAKGSGDSYGYHLYGRFSLTPLGNKEDLPTRIFIHFPFLLKNFTGIQRSEWENITNLDFQNQQFSILKGDPTAKKDYAYGIELDGLFRIGEMRISIGVGNIIETDRRRTAIKIDENLLNTGITLSNLSNYYQPARDSRGYAQYIFASIRYQKIGFVVRYYENTDNGTMSGKLKAKEGLPIAEQLWYQDTQDGIMGNLSLEQVMGYIRSGTVDLGKSKTKTWVAAIEYFMNKRYKMALGIKQATSTQTDGNPYTITPLEGNQVTNYTTDNFASVVNSQLGLPANTLNDKDIIGSKRIDKQIFFRSKFSW